MNFLNKSIRGYYYDIFTIRKNGTFVVQKEIKATKTNMRILEGKICEVNGQLHTIEEGKLYLEEINATRRALGLKGTFKIITEMSKGQEIHRTILENKETHNG